MIVLFRPAPPFVEFCKVENGKFSVEKVKFMPDEINEIIQDPSKVEGIGYLLHHGGEICTETESIINREVLDKLGQCIGFSPECNDLTLKMARIFFKKFPHIPQILFCDTAYFNDLPPEASNYAVPSVLRKQGIKRYGGNGLLHSWVSQKMQQVENKSFAKLISVHLGDNSNIAAIKDGRPVDTTIGFTSCEGLPSSRGCGDVDPTVVFQLHSKGVSFEGIYDLLSNESGFTGLAGCECHYLDIIKENKIPNISKVKQVLLYDIIKYIGAFVSLMNGVDAVVFNTRYPDESEAFISEICEKLNFLGLKQGKIIRLKDSFQGVTETGAKVAVLCVKKDQWNIMFNGVEKIVKKEM